MFSLLFSSLLIYATLPSKCTNTLVSSTGNSLHKGFQTPILTDYIRKEQKPAPSSVNFATTEVEICHGSLTGWKVLQLTDVPQLP